MVRIKYLILIFILFSSPWYWRILNYSINVAVFLLTITFTLFTLMITEKNEQVLSFRNKVLITITIFLSSIFILFLIRSDFDISLLRKTEQEAYALNERRSYYPKLIGGIFQNKVNLKLHGYLGNFFANLDPNVYFFAGHPREQSGISEFEKFSPSLTPFFIIGLFWNIGNRFLFTSSLWILISSGFFNPESYLGCVLFFPLICVLISQGIIMVITKIGKFRTFK